jgi:hypothetical protein
MLTSYLPFSGLYPKIVQRISLRAEVLSKDGSIRLCAAVNYGALCFSESKEFCTLYGPLS